MKKKMVIVKHFISPGHYLFLVPEKMLRVSAGQLVECDTKKGYQFGVCLCDSFDAEPEEICPMFNVNPKSMKYIVAEFFKSERYDPPQEVSDENGQPE